MVRNWLQLISFDFTVRCQPVIPRTSMCNELKGRGTPNGFPMVQRPGLTANLSNNEFIGIKFFGETGTPPLSDECLDYLMHCFCLQASPPCNPATGLPMLICESNCKMLQRISEEKICSNLDQRLMELYELTQHNNFKILADVYFSSNCSDPANYYLMNVTHPDPELCTNMFSPEMECKPNAS